MSKDVVDCEVPFGSLLLLNNLVPHRSLPNFSNGVRWSLDLRWQRGGEPNGFHGLKASKLMRSAGDPLEESSTRMEWGEWANEDRTIAQFASLTEEQRGAVEAAGALEGRVHTPDYPELDTTIAGPWMHRWDMVHHNRHTANLDPNGGLHGWGGGTLEKKK